MPRLITYDDHPPEIMVARAADPEEALAIANDNLPDDDSSLQCVVWARDEAQGRLLTTPIETLAELFKASGHNDYSDKIPEADFSVFSTEVNDDLKVIEQPNSPFLIQFLCAAQRHAPLIQVQTFYQPDGTELDPHIDVDMLDKEQPNKNEKFMKGRECRVLWNEVSSGKDSQEVGTLYWSFGTRPIENAKFAEAVQQQKIYLAKQLAVRMTDNVGHMFGERSPTPNDFSIENAWQLRNGDVAIMPVGRRWGMQKYPWHSPFPKNKLDPNSPARIVHRLDMSFK